MPKAKTTTAELARRWLKKPVAFVEEVIGGKPDPWQTEALEALASKKKIALKACKGPGKTWFLACAIMWWMFTRPKCNIVAMSITGDNLRDNLWTELARVINNSPLLSQYFEHKGERIVSRSSPKDWWCSARSFPANADRGQQANTIAGLHGRFPMVVCDEVGDYPDGVVVAAEAIFANDVDARLLIAGNPTQTEGPLWRVCNRDRYDWWVKEITGDPDDPNRASRISREWAMKMIADWGRENDWVKVNVFGQFPSAQANKLLGPEDISRSMQLRLAESVFRQDPLIYGIDVARFGDNESVLAKRRGKQGYSFRTWRELDLMSLADQLMIEIINGKPDATFIDASGVGGGLYDRLKQLGASVISVDAGSAPIDSARFLNRRAEMWWTMCDWVKKGGCLPNDAQLARDLLAPNYDYAISNKQSKFKIESKADLKKRGLASPDKADGFSLTFAAPVYASQVLPGGLQMLHEQRYTRILGGTEDSWDPFAGG